MSRTSAELSSELHRMTRLLVETLEPSVPDTRDVPPAAPMPALAVQRAAELLASIRRRDAIFAEFPGLFGDPALNILLDLSCSQNGGPQVSVGDACVAAGLPSTTALRCVRSLEDQGLVCRIPDPADRRRQHVILSERGMALMTQFLQAPG